MTAYDWAPFQKADEKLLWSGSASVRAIWRTIVLGIGFFGITAFWFGHIAFNYSSLGDYCADHYTRGCAKAFWLRWPGLVASTGFVLCGILTLPISWFRWACYDYAVTDRHALLIYRAIWRKSPPKLYVADLPKEKPRIEHGEILFGASKYVCFRGLSQNQIDTVLSLVDNLTKVQRT